MNTPKSVYTLPLSINASVDTMQEHLAIRQTPVSPDSRNKLIAIHRSTDRDIRHKTDLIGIRQQAHPQLPDAAQTILMHYFEDAESPSGWSHVEFPLPDVFDPGSKEKALSGVRELTGFYQNGITYLFVQYQSPVAEHSRSVKILWSVVRDGRPVWEEKKWDHRGDDARSVLASVRQLSVHRRSDGQHVLYGVTRGFGDPELKRGEEEFFMVLPRPPVDQNRITVQDIAFDTLHDSDHEVPNWDGIENASIYQLAAPLQGEADAHNNEYTLLRLRKGAIEFHTTTILPASRFYAYPRLGFKSGSVRVNSGTTDLSNARVLAVPGGASDALLIHQPDGELGLLEAVQSPQPRYRSLIHEAGPAKIDRLSIGVVGQIGSETSTLAIFATEPKRNTLWLLRLNAQTTDEAWVCLGDQVSDMACPRVMPDGAELFQVSSEAGKIEYKHQHSETYSWTTTELAVAVSDVEGLEPINAHVIDIEVTDANLIPCARQQVSLTADTPCLIYIDGLTYRVGPHQPLELTSNAYGRIRGVIPAVGLKSPTFEVAVKDAKNITVHPNARITERLAGNAKGFNVSKAISEWAPAEHRATVSQLVKSYGDAASKAKRNVKCDGSLRKQYRMSVGNAGSLVDETTLATPISALPLPGLAGDVLNHIKQGFAEISQLVVRIFDASVEFLIQIGDKIFRFTNAVFDTIVDSFEALGEFLGKVFKALGKGIEEIGRKILDAVSFVFGGADVFAANDALQAAVKAGFRTTASAAATLGREMNAAYQAQIDKLDEQLDSLIGEAQKASGVRSASAEQGISFGGVSIPAPTALVKTNRAGCDVIGGSQNKLDDVEAKCNVPESEADVFRTLMERLKSNYEKDVGPVIEEIKEKMRSDQAFLDKLSAMPLELLRLLKGVVKTVAKLAGDVLEAALELVNILLNRLFDALDTRIEIPFLNTLVQLWSGDSKREVSYFDLLTLPFAFIGTAIWKIVSGAALVTQVQTETFIPWMEQLDTSMDLPALIRGHGKPVHRSLGAAAVTDATEEEERKKKNSDIKSVLKLLLALNILASIGGILVGFTAQPVTTVAEILGNEAGGAGIVVNIQMVIPIIIMVVAYMIEVFYQALEGVHLASGERMTSWEKSSAIVMLVLSIAVMVVLAVYLISAVIIKALLKIPDVVVNLILNIVSLVKSVGLICYRVYLIVDNANALNKDSGQERYIWGIGLGLAAGVAELIKLGGTVSVMIATVLMKAEGISGAVGTAIAVGLQTTGTLLAEGTSITGGYREYALPA